MITKREFNKLTKENQICDDINKVCDIIDRFHPEREQLRKQLLDIRNEHRDIYEEFVCCVNNPSVLGRCCGCCTKQNCNEREEEEEEEDDT